jgi:hypothetical protein
MDHPEPPPIGEPIVDEFAVDVEPAERAAQADTVTDETATDEPATDEQSADEPGELPAAELDEKPAEAPAEESHGSDDPVTD